QIRAAPAFLADGSQQIRVRADAKSPWQVLQTWSAEETVGGVVGFAPDNRHVYLLSSLDANAARLVEIDPTTGATRAIAEDSQYDAGDAMIHPRTHVLEAIQFARARMEWTIVDSSIQPHFDLLKTVHDGDFDVVSRDLNDK